MESNGPQASGQKTSAGPFPVSNATMPYWRSQLHWIDEYRSTEALPTECDIAIIGAGMSGMAAAYHLFSKTGPQKPSMVMLEARQVCSGATARNGGHAKAKVKTRLNLAKEFGMDFTNEFSTMIHRLIYALKDVVETEQLECEFELRRTFDVFFDQAEAAAVEKQWLEHLQAGEAWTKEIDFIPGSRVEQVTSLKGARAAFSGPACSFWPYKFVTQLLAKLIERHAVNLQTNTPVCKVTHNPDGTSMLHTHRGVLRARKVIFATNAYTSGLLPQYVSTLVPTKITATHISPSHPLSVPHLSNTYNLSYALPVATNHSEKEKERVDYLNPRPNGTIVVGGGNWTYKPNAPKSIWWNNWDDSSLLPSTSTKQHFDDLMPTYFRGWETSGAKVDSIWTGITGTTGDGLPFIGKVPDMGKAGVASSNYVLAGYNGGGMAMIWLCAEGVAKMVVEGVGFRKTGLPSLMDAEREMVEFES